MSSAQSVVELFDQIGFRHTVVTDELVVTELDVAPHSINTNGAVQGGLLATLVDIAAGLLAVRQAPTGQTAVTSDLNLRYLRAITAGAARATARLVHSGRRSMVVQVEVTCAADDQLAAIATVSFATIPKPGS
jgi:uncharacterized protein (TIGR00369 family)